METIRISKSDRELRPEILKRAGIPADQLDPWLESEIPAYQATGFFEAQPNPSDLPHPSLERASGPEQVA